MSDDEKLTSRDNESPAKADSSSLSGASDKDSKPDTLSAFPAGDAKPLETGLDPDYGMPSFGFFDDDDDAGKAESKDLPKIPGGSEAGSAAKAGLEIKPSEETGWESADSIEITAEPVLSEKTDDSAEESVAASSSSADTTTVLEEVADTPEIDSILKVVEPEEEAERPEATVMPFPGAPLQRPAEREPAESLRVIDEQEDAPANDIFLPGGEAPAEALPDVDLGTHDTIADAVQSALRNVYGGVSQPADEETVDPGNFTVADSLRQAAAAAPQDDDDYWSDRPSRNEDSQADLLGAQRGGGDTDAVLDYLYNERRGGDEQAPISPEASLRDLSDALGYDRDPQPQGSTPAYDEPPAHAGGRGYEQPYSGFGQPRGQSGYTPEQNYHDDRQANSDWEEQPYVVTSSTDVAPDHFPSSVGAGTQESLASGSPDSSHLLGAAGLGLIGGIALAGVLAVFVFNSFVDEVDGPSQEAAVKVIDRLDAPAEQQQPEAPVAIAQVQPSQQPPAQAVEEPRFAAVQPEVPAEIIPQTPPAPANEPSVVPEQILAPEINEQAQPSTAPDPNARILVSDVSGEAGGSITLNIALGNPADEQSSLISLKGLPSFAKLSTGIDVGGGQWLLPPSNLSELSITTPAGSKGLFTVEAELLKDDAQTAIYGPVAFKLRIGRVEQAAAQANQNLLAGAQAVAGQGGSNPGSTSQQAAKLAEVSDGGSRIETDFLTQMLIRDGNKLMRDGDILGARRLYEQAAADGNPEAALAMGRSFDPSYFEKLEVKTGKPDPAEAFQWYKRALDGGLVTARVKIDGLKQWLQR